ncbi:hypothetical protein AB0M29_12360 [Streptomyces sp. NPDC051976]|uniref:hypothetical protein n=1 Tax=Streptomyces sp. NPDC051976 TaxID=3154947 RepID=UPI00341B504A
MTRRSHTTIGTTLLATALLLGTAACGSSSSAQPSGPTAAQAGTRLSQDGRALLTDMQKLLAAPRPFTVTTDAVDAAKATACGKDKGQRAFAGRMQVPATPNAHVALITDEGSTNGYLAKRGYSLDTNAKRDASDSKRTAPMVDTKAGVHLTVTLTPAAGGLVDYVVTGTTDCLRAS